MYQNSPRYHYYLACSGHCSILSKFSSVLSLVQYDHAPRIVVSGEAVLKHEEELIEVVISRLRQPFSPDLWEYSALDYTYPNSRPEVALWTCIP